MSRQHYEELIKQLCELTKIDEAQSIIDGGPLAVNEVIFSLHNPVQINQGVLLIYCDFGEVAAGREAEAYRALLETNMLMFAASGPMYTISPLTGRVIFANHYAVTDFDARSLRNTLAHLAGKAKEWRKTHFF